MRLFISYAHVDRRIVNDWLVRHLRVSHDVFIDDQLRVGQAWRDQLEREIGSCDALVYAMTPDSLASRECLREVEFARKKGKHIIPVKMQANAQPPAWLSELQYADLSNGDDPHEIARLLDGIKRLEPATAAPLPTNAPVKPVNILRDPATQTILTLLGLVVAVVAILIALPDTPASPTPTLIPIANPSPTPTLPPTDVPPTSTPAPSDTPAPTNTATPEPPTATPTQVPTATVIQPSATTQPQAVSATSTPMQAITDTPTNPTSLPTARPTPLIVTTIATAEPTDTGCVAQIDPQSVSEILRVVRTNHYISAPLSANVVRRGQYVYVQNEFSDGTSNVWYEISATSIGDVIGWLQARYVVLSETC